MFGKSESVPLVDFKQLFVYLSRKQFASIIQINNFLLKGGHTGVIAMMNVEGMALLDALLIKRIEEAQNSANRTDQQLGEQAFGWLKSPKMKIQSIKGYGDRKPQQLRLADYINVCEALGLPWADECKNALKIVKNERKINKKK